MIFKIIYQENPKEPPLREKSKVLYVEGADMITVRKQLRENTPYLVEYIQVLDEAHLAYEQQDPDFKLTEFSHWWPLKSDQMKFMFLPLGV